MACSRHDALTMQIPHIDLASSAAASESGKKTAGSKPLQAPWCRHDRFAPDIELPLDHGDSPARGSVCVRRHTCKSYQTKRRTAIRYGLGAKICQKFVPSCVRQWGHLEIVRLVAQHRRRAKHKLFGLLFGANHFVNLQCRQVPTCVIPRGYFYSLVSLFYLVGSSAMP